MEKGWKTHLRNNYLGPDFQDAPPRNRTRILDLPKKGVLPPGQALVHTSQLIITKRVFNEIENILPQQGLQIPNNLAAQIQY